MEEDSFIPKANAKVAWLGKAPTVAYITKSKKGNTWEIASLTFINKKSNHNIKVDRTQGDWFVSMLQKIAQHPMKVMNLQDIKAEYETAGLEDFELFWDNKPINTLYPFGLLHL